MAAAEARKRRPKGHFAAGRAKRPRGGGRQLEAGMRGILITCNMNERKCVGEAYSLLGEYGDRLYGPEQFSDPEERLSGSEREEDEDDVEAALKKEVGQIRTLTEQKLRRFQSVESGANNVVFIRTQGIEPENLVHHILKDMHATKKKKTRVILRMLPVSGTCKAFMEDMKKYTETFFEPWFKAPKKGTFQIVYKARNNSHMSREEVIKELAGIVGSLNPENKVDLNNPQYTIVVEIIKSVCCLSVVRDYVLFRKYNLQEVVKSKEDTQQNPSSLTEEQNSELVKPETVEEEEEKEKSSNEVKQENNHGEGEELK
ncbi:THUMP domain-containing protein 1 [Cuculus canorus]|uniref:THUMP domain-containing protein 1 n=1 Tax=Cuculus canorus TaxID=55661 RepID=UPI0023AB0AAA|nr:THUMP domain-containing protein 1 [Cuculus canorus]XP_053936347.1 THUMP domain-containing protein 1 [Cuculus canorus]